MKTDMFRYLEKYVGTYRVKAHYSEQTGDFPRNATGGIDDSFDDLYIECGRGEIRHSYIPDTLVWFTEKLSQGRNVKKTLEASHQIEKITQLDRDEERVECKGNFNFVYEECGDDVLIWFDSKDIKKIAEVVNPRTAGKSISPFSVANLPKGDYTIPDEDLKKFTAIYSSLDTTAKMHFAKDVIKKYDDVIASKKGKKVLEARKESGLKPKEYIHYLGMWKDFIKFATKEFEVR